ncbi:prolipoprotein diacylglyceryl transferase [Nocardioides terrae]|nr:prolipoprotein diacylglyceryl transferase [Nocardioides terrae]
MSIPSPSQGVWHLGPVPIRGYALCIVLGIFIAVWISERRWVARGGKAGQIQDIGLWAVPFGIIGARLYHVATDHDLYFGAGRSAWDILYIWHGGLGIWGGIAGGALGAYIGARQHDIRMRPLMDVIAPSLLVAQALGRFGNWFNQELYGRPTDLPWGLKIDEAHRVPGYADFATFHPTFLYEALWNLAGFALILWLERPRNGRSGIGYGRVMALYVIIYTAGRFWIEQLRIDTVELHDVFGLRFNVWTSIVLFVAAVAYFVWSLRRNPGRESQVYADRPAEAPAPAAED